MKIRDPESHQPERMSRNTPFLIPQTGSYRTIKMNNKLWQSCTDPKILVKYLEEDAASCVRSDQKPVASDRQCKLIALEVMRQAKENGWFTFRTFYDIIDQFENWIETGIIPDNAGWDFGGIGAVRKQTGIEIMVNIAGDWGHSWQVNRCNNSEHYLRSHR